MFTIYLCLVVLSLFADFRLHAGKADFSLDYPRSMFSNSLFSVSNDGNDTACENDLSTPCETISRACVLGESPRQVMVDTGIFKETQAVVVDAALIITGQSSSRCIVTKVNDTSFTLFTVNNKFANLTLTNLVILLTDDGENCYFILASASDHIVMNECQITAHGSSDDKNTLSNVPFSVDSENTVFQINSCTIYNIATLKDAFIQVQYRNVNLSIAKSSFVNVGSNGNGGCFYCMGSSDVSLKECFFSECSSFSGGIGYMDLVDGSGCTIQSCTFLNCAATTSSIGGGVWYMNPYNERSLTITKTSFVNCKTLGNGGVLYLNSNIHASLSDCSFTLCAAGRDGGAFYIQSSCVADISRCTFIECTASGYGGAMYVSSSSVSIVDSVFVANSGYSGNDTFAGGTTILEFLRTFTDKESVSSAIRCSSCMKVDLHLKIDYDNATCDGNFSTQGLEECQMPCAEINPGSEVNTSACVKPDDCPFGFAALAGSCVRTSVFSAPSDTLCEMDFSLGYPLCVPCAARKAHSDSVESLPCGSTFCFQQISNGGSGNGSLSTSCALTCDASHFEEDSNGRCRLLPCYARTAVSSLDYPCGTADCNQEISNGGSGYGSLSTSCALSCDANHFEEDSNGWCRLLPCDARTAESSLDYPCGTTDCFQQVSNGGSGKGNLSTSCALSCDANHFEVDSNGRCRLLPCDARTAVSSLDYPCGTSDCFQQTNHKGTFINECRDTASQTNNSKGGGLSAGIIVLIVVGSVVGSVVAIVVIMLLVWKKRRQKAYLLPEGSLNPGVEIKDYLVHRREQFESQNAEFYVFVRGGEKYTVKLVRSRNGICSGDLSWAVDFSAKVNSKFLVKYIETIIGNRGEFYIVMEHCEKGDFRAVLKAIKSVREDAVLGNEAVMKIMIQLLLGLEVLHSNGVVHCDLDLGSVFFDEKGDAKIGNFGCTQCDKPSTEEGGKLLELENADYVPAGFRSHEYLAEKKCTFSTDMLCLGFILADAFTFPKDISSFNEEELTELGMSPEILLIVASLMREDPNSRPSAAALLQDPYVLKYAEQFGFLKYYPHSSTN